MGGYIKDKITRKLHSRAANMDRKIFNGKTFVVGVPFKTASKYYQGFVNAVNGAASVWKSAPSNQKTGPVAGGLMKEINTKMRWAKAMAKVFPALQSAWKQKQIAAGKMEAAQKRLAADANAKHEKLCKRWYKATDKGSDAKKRIHRAIHQLKSGNQELSQARFVHAHREALEGVDKVCKEPVYKGSTLFTNDCPWARGSRMTLSKPKYWCEASHKREELLRGMVMNQLKREAKQAREFRTGRFMGASAARVKKQDGWIELESWHTYANVTSWTDTELDRVLKHIKPLVASVGIQDATTLPFWKAFEKRKADLKSEIDRLAPTWKSDKKKGADYSVNLAKKQLKKVFKKAKKAKAFLRRKEWKIYKTSLGIPKYRTRKGLLQYQMPGEPWCQLRSYTLTEDYKGGRRYQKAKDVSFGYTRWQKCQ